MHHHGRFWRRGYDRHDAICGCAGRAVNIRALIAGALAAALLLAACAHDDGASKDYLIVKRVNP